MTSSRRALLWSSAIAVPVVVGAAILVPIAASGAVDLPDKSPEELIEFAGASDVRALSGTIEQTSDLGLPDLGALTGSIGSDSAEGAPTSADIDDLIDLVTGSHTAKVFVDGESARLQVLDQLAERNVYVDGTAGYVWYVDSEAATATRFSIPEPAERDSDENRADDTVATPDELLDQALASADETTEITVGTDARVAGRDAYELIVTPRSDDTLVGELRFAIDGENGTALAASVAARGATAPTFEVAFTQVDFTAPDASVFAFEPAEGVTVTDKDLTEKDSTEKGSAENEPPTDAATPVVTGEGWSSIVELPSTSGADVLSSLDPEQSAMLESVTTVVDGGRALQTSLVTVLITDDGRVLAGAVPVSRLVEAALTDR